MAQTASGLVFLSALLAVLTLNAYGGLLTMALYPATSTFQGNTNPLLATLMLCTSHLNGSSRRVEGSAFLFHQAQPTVKSDQAWLLQDWHSRKPYCSAP